MPVLAPDQAAVNEAERWIAEPIYWARKFGGEAFDPSSDQEAFWIEYGKMLNARIRKYKGVPLSEEDQYYNGKIGISIRAGQGVGKGATLSLCGIHYLMVLHTLKPKVVCTAPAGTQLRSSLWPEYAAWMGRSAMIAEVICKQANRIFLLIDKERGEATRIEPRTVQKNSSMEEQQEILAGIHALGVMYQVDEASGVQDPVFKPIEGGLTDPLSLIIMIWNPTRRNGFAMESHRKNRVDWVCLHWSGRKLRQEKLDQPHRFKWFNEEAQLRLIRKYGEDSDFVRVRVDGEPPNEASDALIPFSALGEARARQVGLLPTDPLVLGVDVGGGGDGDPTIVTVFRGPRTKRIVKVDESDTSKISDRVAEIYADEVMGLPRDVQTKVGVDYIGIGRGVYDQCVNTHELPCVAVDVSEESSDKKRWHRKRDEVWWMGREAFRDDKTPSLSDEIEPLYLDELEGELTSIKWGEPDGKIKVQGKGTSGIPNVPPLAKSPNFADSWLIGWYVLKKFCSHVPVGHRRRSLRGRMGGKRHWRTR
jgi:hypothetical protein